MTIQEAIKSGKDFRHEYGAWMYVHPKCGVLWRSTNTDVEISVDQILSSGWQIEEEKVTITREQLERAVMDAMSICNLYGFPVSKYVSKELGFK
jgi:hypothetical protein